MRARACVTHAHTRTHTCTHTIHNIHNTHNTLTHIHTHTVMPNLNVGAADVFSFLPDSMATFNGSGGNPKPE